jgi:predicted transcriptional regulator of viral defense system
MRTVDRAGCDREQEARLLRLAARQHGVVTRAQAVENGLTKSMLQTRVRSGRLRRIHPGVYCVGGSPATFEQRAFAAAAWAGPGSVLSHRSAGFLWSLVDRPPPVDELWTPRRRTRPPSGVCAHFTNDVAARDRGRLRNIPITSPARTLIDLAGVLPAPGIEAALAKAIVERRTTARALAARLRDMSRQGFEGPRLLRRLLVQSNGRWHAGSPLERRVAEVLSCPELPPFRREHAVYVDGGVYYLDFAWPHFRVGVEADSRRWHSDVSSFEGDRRRHNSFTAAGWRVLRVTEPQVRADPAAVRERVRELIVRG